MRFLAKSGGKGSEVDRPRYTVGLIVGLLACTFIPDYVLPAHAPLWEVSVVTFALAGAGAVLGYLAGKQIEALVPENAQWWAGRADLLLFALISAAIAVWLFVSLAERNFNGIGWLILAIACTASFTTIYFQSRIGGFISAALIVPTIVIYDLTANPAYLGFAAVCAILSLPLYLYRRH